MLKNMLKVGLTNTLMSMAPILIYFVLSFMYSNSNIEEGFSITYPFQFIFMALYNILVIGQLKGEAKQKDIGRGSYLGSLMFILVGLMIIASTYILRAPFLNHFNLSIEEYTEIAIYSLFAILIDYTMYTITVISQYQEKHKKTLMISIFWYLSRVTTVILVPLFISDYHKGLLVIVGIQFIVFIAFICKLVHIKGSKASLKNGIKYSLASLPSNIFMTIIYFTGYGNVAVYPGYFEAYNLEALCTDTQWDILSSGIDTTVSVAVCKNSNLKLKKAIPSSIIYSLILFLSSAIMLAAYSILNPAVDMTKTIIVYLIECSTFPLYATQYSIGAKLQITSPTILMSIFTIIRYVIRTIVTAFIHNPYSISFGVQASCIVGFISWIIIWVYTKRKVNKGLD